MFQLASLSKPLAATVVAHQVGAGAVGWDTPVVAKLPWFGTARARLGYSVGSTLFYATGGYAYGSVKTRVDLTFLGTTTRASFSETKGGWTVGAGIETPFTLLGLFGPNWTSMMSDGARLGTTTCACAGS